MKIGLTAEAVCSGGGDGITTYSNCLIENLQTNKNIDIVLINNKECDKFATIKKIIIPNPFKSISRLYLWHPFLSIILNLKRYDLDIIHSLNTGPSFFKIRPYKYIITVHDILPLVFPEVRPLGVVIIYKLLLSRTLKNADRIICVSNNTKKDLIKHFTIPDDKIRVIYEASDKGFIRQNSLEQERLRSKYHLNFSFILYVGGLAEHKNLVTLLEAYYLIKKEGITHKLVITGKKRWKYKEIFSAIEKYSLNDDVIFTGYIPEEDLPALYSCADVFVYPSLYEGFGLPPLEAMACGCPVITSNSSSLPEIVGDSGILVFPHDVNGFAKSMMKLLSDETFRSLLISKGLERASLFKWEKCASETIEVYQEIIKDLKILT